MMTPKTPSIEEQIIAALAHVEGEEGLYFNNLVVVHEEEERPVVSGDDVEVRAALSRLLKSGSIVSSGSGETTIYRLANQSANGG